MNIKQTVIASALMIGIGTACVAPVTVSAQSTCGGVDTSIVSCPQGGGKGAGVEDSGIWGLLLVVINIFTVGIGVAAIGGVLYGAFVYTTSSGSPDKAKQAKVIIANTVVGLVVYALLYSFLNYIVPGGLFKP
ncbi:hypothetical protein HGB25_00485 [Candidatus Saccharibacteria bacterium]|nr:hypothetical protein [Candidatus Saccharibacteria bacterium]